MVAGIIERSELWMGRGLTGCRSVADADWQSSDTALPTRASLLTAVLAEVLPGVLCVRGVQREFEDLLAVLIFCGVQYDIYSFNFSIKSFMVNDLFCDNSIDIFINSAYSHSLACLLSTSV